MPFILNSAFIASYIGFTSDHHSQRLISTSPASSSIALASPHTRQNNTEADSGGLSNQLHLSFVIATYKLGKVVTITSDKR